METLKIHSWLFLLFFFFVFLGLLLEIGVERGGQCVFPSELKLKKLNLYFCVLLKYEICDINSELVITNIMYFDITG